jgi:hypothetical protein
MQWIILIGDTDFNISSVRDIKHFGKNHTIDLTPNRFVVDFGDGHVFYDYVEEIINDYETEDLKKIPFPHPQFVMMIYTSEDLMKNIVCQENFLKGIYVDDDHGSILPIEEFIKRFSG